MTFQVKPKYARKGRASASAGSGATIIRLLTDKEKLHLSEVQVGPSGHPPFLQKENQGEGDVGPQANKIYSI